VTRSNTASSVATAGAWTDPKKKACGNTGFLFVFREVNTLLNETIYHKEIFMFAILISTENLPVIALRMEHHSDFDMKDLDMYIRSHRDWYMITGYIDFAGKFHSWSIQPKYLLKTDFEYDADKIQTQWDQIVRKPK
jgi:hypothetical protein